MDYNRTTRNELYQNFIKNHSPSALYVLKNGAHSKDVFEVITGLTYSYDEHQQKVYSDLQKSIDGYEYTPAKFFKDNYRAVVSLCAGSKSEEKLLYAYFDKLNQFPYSVGISRRSVRTKTYIDPVDSVKKILYAAYHIQIYNTTLDKYLLDDMSREMLDYKKNSGRILGGVEDLIAAHLDAGDIAVKKALEKIITGDNNTAFITVDIIRGIFKSDDKDLHRLLGQLLVAARLQEGLRQAICENMDCGTASAFKTLFEVIENNELVRFSSVRRAVATWIGILDPDSLMRSSDKTFRLMKQALSGTDSARQLTDSDDAMSIVVGLWGLGFYEVDDALKVMYSFAESGTAQQKRAAAFYNVNIYYKRIQQKFANRLIETMGDDIELAAAVFSTYMPDCNRRAYAASGGWGEKRSAPQPVDIKQWFDSRETARKHMGILLQLLAAMKHKKYIFNPHLFPWYMVDITRGQVMIRISAIANGLGDSRVMDEMAEKLSDFDGQSGERSVRTRLLFTPALSPARRNRLIIALGDKETYTRREAFYVAKNMQFTANEYDEMCAMLRFKAQDLRLNLISLIKKQDEKGLQRSLQILLTDKKEDMRLAGLDIVNGLKNENKTGPALETGLQLTAAISEPTQREKALINDILYEATYKKQQEENPLYSPEDIITPAKITRNKPDYPIFKISRERLGQLFTQLDDLIESYKDYEVKTAYGEKVLLTESNGLPRMKYVGSPEEVYPLTDVWKQFYNEHINGEGELLAMLVAVNARNVQINSNVGNACDEYNRYLLTLSENIFGRRVTEFDRTVYRYGKIRNKGMFFYYNENLLRRVVKLMADMLLGNDCRFAFGVKVSRYLCRCVPQDKRGQTIYYKTGSIDRQEYITPLNARIFSMAVDFMCDSRQSPRQWKERFEIMYALDSLYRKKTDKDGESYIGGKPLRSLDYVSAAYYGAITDRQMFRGIFEDGNLRDKLHSLFAIYRAERWTGLKKTIEKYGIYKDEKLKEFLLDAADKAADRIVSVECRRTDSPTLYSPAVTAIEFFYGTDHLASLLTALGDDKFVRRDSFGFGTGGGKRENLCHLVSVCHPRPGDSADTLAKALAGRNISDKRLIETAMYAPQWMDIIEQYLHFTGLKTGAYYFIAHMNDRYGTDRRRFAEISRFTPLDKQELLDGAFDIDWFNEAYAILGEKRFDMLYDAAKYISDGSRHTRARKYADAALGRVDAGRLEEQIKDKRNKDLLMSYPLVPLKDRRDMLHRYQFIQQFRKESTQFGAQRRASEGTACDMALRNLATRAGFKDTTRLILAMENDLSESMKDCFVPREITADSRTVKVCLTMPEYGRSKVEIIKDGKKLSSLPAAFKKDKYVLLLKENAKKIAGQYSRTVKMFEQAMEDRETYTAREIYPLKANPALSCIVDNLVFICDGTGVCGIVKSADELVGEKGQTVKINAGRQLRVAHPYDLYTAKSWSAWQKFFFEKQQADGSKQPLRQVFRQLYVKLDEELDSEYSRQFAGYQIRPQRTVAALKGRRWTADPEQGLQKVYYRDDIAVNMYALADWFSPSDIEAPTLEYVAFYDRKNLRPVKVGRVPDIVYSETMRDVDLAVSIANAGAVDPLASHSTIEMRRVIARYNAELFGLENVTVKDSHAFIKGTMGEYTVHLGSGAVHMRPGRLLNVLPVHSQHRGKIFLPFLDEDPKTAEIISKILLFADDAKIKDPYILNQMQ